jgi:DUF917 family protein
MALPADEAGLRALVYGGAILGCGGGGSLVAGLKSARDALAVGVPRIVPLDGIAEDATLATLSAVGSASATSGAALSDSHFKRALDLFGSFSRQRVSGFIASEVGPRAVTYGLRESAHSGLPVVDAPANGRAHPLFVMGSLGLHAKPRRATTTVAIGGVPDTPDYVEIAIRANVMKAARIVRDRAAQGGIALAVIRNPLPVSVVRQHAAVGGLAYAQRMGRILLERLPQGTRAVLSALSRAMGGQVFGSGYVVSVKLYERHGFTLGKVAIILSDGSTATIPVCNEFMGVSVLGRRVAAFPDLIAVFDRESGLPLASAEIKVNSSVSLFIVPRERLLLGTPMRDVRLLRQVERLTRTRFAAAPTAGR